MIDLKGKTYLRIDDIVGKSSFNNGVPLIPVCKATWWNGVKSGRYPKPVKISARCTAWRLEDINALIESFNSTNTN